MDSNSTLVNPAPSVTLCFDRNSTLNATISVRGNPVYRVSTPGIGSTRTEVTDANTQRVLITLQRREILADTVTFADRNGGKPIKHTKWLKSHKLPDGWPVVLLETEYGTYVWKSDRSYRLALYVQDDFGTPVAHTKGATTTSAMRLFIHSSGSSIRDDIIASFLILEQKMRIREKLTGRDDGLVSRLGLS